MLELYLQKHSLMNKKVWAPLALLIWQSASSQVEVRNEPRHKNVFENDYLRILDVHIKPGDTTMYHRHALPSVIVMLSSVGTGSQLLGGSASSGKSKNGNTWYAGYGEKPIVHRVWNEDTKMFHVMDIELFVPGGAEKFEPLKEESFQLAFQEKGVNAYSINLAASKEIKAGPDNHPQLLVCTAGKLEMHSRKNDKIVRLENGIYVWIEAGDSYQLSNSGDQDASAILIELVKKDKI
jgi:quercetin dioxygenase-like cupin family protein